MLLIILTQISCFLYLKTVLYFVAFLFSAFIQTDKHLTYIVGDVSSGIPIEVSIFVLYRVTLHKLWFMLRQNLEKRTKFKLTDDQTNAVTITNTMFETYRVFRIGCEFYRFFCLCIWKPVKEVALQILNNGRMYITLSVVTRFFSCGTQWTRYNGVASVFSTPL